MNGSESNPDISYLQGQIYGLQAIVLGMANTLSDKETFRQESLRRIESFRTAALSSPVAETTLDGINAIEQWLLHVTQ